MSSKKQENCIGYAFNFLKLVALVILLSVFGYWSTNAYLKYINEPISTQINFRYGDDGHGNVSLPNLSICVDKLEQLKAFTKCGKTAKQYFSFLGECLSHNSSFDAFLSLLKFPLENVYAEIEPTALTGAKAKAEQARIWKPEFHRVFGFCYNFNIYSTPEYKTIPISDAYGNPGIRVLLKNMDPKATVRVLLHSGYDAADAQDLYPHFEVLPNTSYTAYLVKRVIESISTKAQPCYKFPKQTCGYINFYNRIMKNYNCETIIVPSHYIGQDVPAGIQMCNDQQYKSLLSYVLANIKDMFVNCPSKQACNQPKYIMQLAQGEIQLENVSNTIEVRLLLADPIVEYSIDSISYDLQNLIGEVGGTLGLTLGVSFFSIIGLLEIVVLKAQACIRGL